MDKNARIMQEIPWDRIQSDKKNTFTNFWDEFHIIKIHSFLIITFKSDKMCFWLCQLIRCSGHKLIINTQNGVQLFLDTCIRQVMYCCALSNTLKWRRIFSSSSLTHRWTVSASSELSAASYINRLSTPEIKIQRIEVRRTCKSLDWSSTYSSIMVDTSQWISKNEPKFCWSPFIQKLLFLSEGNLCVVSLEECSVDSNGKNCWWKVRTY